MSCCKTSSNKGNPTDKMDSSKMDSKNDNPADANMNIPNYKADNVTLSRSVPPRLVTYADDIYSLGNLADTDKPLKDIVDPVKAIPHPNAASIFEAAVPRSRMIHVKMPQVPHLIMQERTVMQIEDCFGRYVCALLNNQEDGPGSHFTFKDLSREEMMEASFLCDPEVEVKIYQALKEVTLDLRPKLTHEAVFIRLETVPDDPCDICDLKEKSGEPKESSRAADKTICEPTEKSCEPKESSREPNEKSCYPKQSCCDKGPYSCNNVKHEAGNQKIPERQEPQAQILDNKNLEQETPAQILDALDTSPKPRRKYCKMHVYYADAEKSREQEDTEKILDKQEGQAQTLDEKIPEQEAQAEVSDATKASPKPRKKFYQNIKPARLDYLKTARRCPKCGGYFFPASSYGDPETNPGEEEDMEEDEPSVIVNLADFPVRPGPPPEPTRQAGCILNARKPVGPCVCDIPKRTRCACDIIDLIRNPVRQRKFLMAGVMRDAASKVEDEPLYSFKGFTYVLDPDTKMPVALAKEQLRIISVERPALRHTQSAYFHGQRIPETTKCAHITLCLCGNGVKEIIPKSPKPATCQTKNVPGVISEAVQKEMAKYLVAFLNNSEGGMFDLGTSGERVVGFHCTVDTENKLRQALDNIADNDIVPKVLPDSYEVRFVKIYNLEESGCKLVCPGETKCCCCDNHRWHPMPPPPRPCPHPKVMMEVRVKPTCQLFSYRARTLYRWNNHTLSIDNIHSLHKKGAYRPYQFVPEDLATVGRWAADNRKVVMRKLGRQLEYKVSELLFYLEQPLRERWFRIMPKAVNTPDP